MNPKRRKDLKLVVKRVQDAKDSLEGIIEEEESSLANMPESLQNSQRASDIQQVLDDLQAVFDNLEEGVIELSNIAGIKPRQDKLTSTADKYKSLDEFSRRQTKVMRAEKLLTEMGYFVLLENERKHLVQLRQREDVMSDNAYQAISKAERAHWRKNQILKKEIAGIFEKQNTRIKKLKEKHK